MTGDEQLELERILVELETARDVARQLRAALADLVPPHASWCMGHEGGVVDGPHGRVGIGKLVVVDCRCEPTVRAAREALASSAKALR
jgi:hypothetical protein